MKLGYLNMLQRLSVSPCIGRAPTPLGTRNEMKSNDDYFDIREILSTLIECPKFRLEQVYYKNVLKTLSELVRRRRRDLWKNASWILQQCNALSVKRYLAKNNIQGMKHDRATSFSPRKSCLLSKQPVSSSWIP